MELVYRKSDGEILDILTEKFEFDETKHAIYVCSELPDMEDKLAKIIDNKLVLSDVIRIKNIEEVMLKQNRADIDYLAIMAGVDLDV